MKDIFVTIHTKEKGKIERTNDEWLALDLSTVTLHRVDAPAIEYSAVGYSQWWIDDECYYQSEAEAIIEEARSLPKYMKLTDPRWWVREL